MPKKCQAPDCNRDVFSHDYCKIHQHMRKDEKWLKSLLKQYKKGNAKIKHKSDKRIAEDKVYAKMNPANTRCFFSNKPLDETKEKHHLWGRSGSNYLDEKFLMWVNHKYHMDYHHKPYDYLVKQPWYEGFLKRLKNIDINLWNKEKRKERKA